VWESAAAARQPDLEDGDYEDCEFLTEARKEDILAGIDEVAAVLDQSGLDSMKTDTIGKLLRTGALDLSITECFLGDGQWDPERCRFEGAPDWDSVRRALETLREAVLEEHLTVQSHPTMRLSNRPTRKNHVLSALIAQPAQPAIASSLSNLSHAQHSSPDWRSCPCVIILRCRQLTPETWQVGLDLDEQLIEAFANQ
jgi:hypothetical protein